jgi:hypothetical protein
MKSTIYNLKKIIHRDYENSNIYVLYYSGGGSAYHPIVHHEIGRVVKGYIFDSSPVPFKQSVFSNWIAEKTQNKSLRYLTRLILYLPMLVIFHPKFCNNILHTYNDYILNTPTQNKTLMITSKSDSLVPVNHIDKIVEKNGYNLLIFDKSDHLSHDLLHPTEYINKMKEFMM